MRIPSPIKSLDQFKSIKLSKEVLLGRDYFLCEFGKILNNNLPIIKEVSFEYKEELNHISLKIKRPLSYETPYKEDDDLTWIKCIPAEPEDVDNQEVYILIALKVKQIGEEYEIQDLNTLARFVDFCEDPNDAIFYSDYFEMPMLPPEVMFELKQLTKGRHIPNNFSLIGKPTPKNSSEFYPARNSGWRNVYTTIEVSTDDNNFITDVEFETNEREVSMLQRPYSMPNDYTDMFDRILDYCDQYTDEEWEHILQIHNP